MRRLRLKIPPPIVTLVAGAAICAIDRRFPGTQVDFPGHRVVAWSVAFLGLAIIISGMRRFVRAGTTIRPEHPENSTSLVTTGVYRFTRNPMYLGLGLWLAAWALGLSNALGFAVLPLFALFLQKFQIEPEEEALSRRFGKDYADYRRRVRRWL